MVYELMNQDRLLLRFRCETDAFGEEKTVEQEWLSELRPMGYTTLDAFLGRRRAPKHRKHIAVLLERAGCDSVEGFLQVTRGLSLNDTFWVREAGSSANAPVYDRAGRTCEGIGSPTAGQVHAVGVCCM